MVFSSIVQKYVDDQHLSSEQVSNLSHRALKNLDNEVIYGLIATNKITVEQALGLTLREHSYYKTVVISRLMANDKLSFEQVREISNRFISTKNIAFPEMEPFSNTKAPSSLTSTEIFIFRFNENLILGREYDIPEMKPFLCDEDFPGLTYMEWVTLGSTKIYELIDQNLLTLDDAIYLDFNEYNALASEAVQQLIAAEKLTVRQARNLRVHAVKIFQEEAIRELIYKNILTVEDACSLNNEEVKNVTSYSINYLLINQKITLKQARSLKQHERERFGGSIRFIIHHDLLTFNQVLELSVNEYENLSSRNIFKLIQIGEITLDRARNFTLSERERIDKFYVFAFDSIILRVKLLTIDQITVLDDTRIEKIFKVFFSAEGLMNKLLSHLHIPNMIVEETISYFTKLPRSSRPLGINLLTMGIEQIEYTGDLKAIESSIKENVSRRVFDKTGSLFKDINDPQFITFIDAAVKVSLEAMTKVMPDYITQLKDKKLSFWQTGGTEGQVISVKEELLRALVEQWWEAEYELEKVVAEMKLPNIIVEEAVSYLQLQSKAATVPKFNLFKASIHHIESSNSVSGIWEFIKENVAKRMLEEAGRFYQAGPTFNDFLDKEGNSFLDLSLNKKFQELKKLKSEHITLVDQHRPPMALSHKNPIEDNDLRLLNIFLDFHNHSIKTGRKARYSLFKSKINDHTTLEEIVSRVVSSIESKSKSRSKNVFITLGWLTTNFIPTDKEPRIKELFTLERAQQSQPRK